MMNRAKTTVTMKYMRVPDDLIEVVQKRSKRHGRSFSNEFVMLAKMGLVAGRQEDEAVKNADAVIEQESSAVTSDDTER